MMIPSQRYLPDELLLLIFESTPHGDRARAARCSKRFSSLLFPLIWTIVYARVPWKTAKALCNTIRRNARIATVVEHFDVGNTVPGIPSEPWADLLEYMPLLLSSLSRLINLRVLVFHFGNCLRFPVLDNCLFPRLQSLSIAINGQTRDFITRHTEVTELETFGDNAVINNLGKGVPLKHVKLISVAALLLLTEPRDSSMPFRRLAPDCYIRLLDGSWYPRTEQICMALNNSGPQIAMFHVKAPLLERVGPPAHVRTAKIRALGIHYGPGKQVRWH